MNNLELKAYVNDRQHQLRRESDQHRMLNSRSEAPAESGEDHKAPLYGPALARMGTILVEMGNQLQDRYGDALDSLPSQSPQQSPATNTNC